MVEVRILEDIFNCDDGYTVEKLNKGDVVPMSTCGAQSLINRGKAEMIRVFRTDVFEV